MTLLRFNHPSVINQLTNDVFYGNLFDSKLDNAYNCCNGAELNYHINDAGTAVNIEFAIPGLSKNDLEIELHNNVLTIKTKQRNENDTRTGFAATQFEKRFKVSSKIVKDEITALSENGVLYLTLPKLSEAIKQPARSIEIA